MLFSPFRRGPPRHKKRAAARGQPHALPTAPLCRSGWRCGAPDRDGFALRACLTIAPAMCRATESTRAWPDVTKFRRNRFACFRACQPGAFAIECFLVASRRAIRAFSSGGERFPDTEEVRSSNLLTPTIHSQPRGNVSGLFSFWFTFGPRAWSAQLIRTFQPDPKPPCNREPVYLTVPERPTFRAWASSLASTGSGGRVWPSCARPGTR